MATLEKRLNADGTTGYRAKVRLKGFPSESASEGHICSFCASRRQGREGHALKLRFIKASHIEAMGVDELRNGAIVADEVDNETFS